MSKTKTAGEKLASFKKANKQARERIAKANGYTVENYPLHLEAERSAETKSAIKEAGKKAAKKAKVTGGELIQDVVIAFDTTGSMYTYLNSVKDHVKETITSMLSTSKGLKIKVVAFGDYCDMASNKTFGKAYQESALTDNANELIKFVTGASRTSGGDSDEFYELVIKKITEETPWREGSKKSVILIADYTPHPLGYSYYDRVVNNQIDWKVEAKKAAEKGIQFDTFKIISSMTWYNDLSRITGGVCMDFRSANKTSEILMASTYARGGASAKAEFSTMFASAVKKGDEELIGAYKSLSTLL